MAILAQECIGWIDSTIGAPTGDAAKQVLNAAGEMLVQLHEWRWLERESTMDVVADQDYASLPSDFRASLRIDQSSSFSGLRQGTPELLNALKSYGFDGDFYYTGAITYKVISSVVTPVLRLDPTPGASISGEFNILYRAGWTEVADDRDTILIVPWVKNLYRELVVAYARGYDEDDAVRAAPAGQLIEEHLAVIKRGITLRMAINRDALVNPSMGRPRRGWIKTGNGIYGGSFNHSYITSVPGTPT